MPTGGGKSMCYQIPALAKKGIVLVICPLIALMQNQVMVLKEKGIAAEFLSSTQTSHVKAKIYEDLESGAPSFKLLYVTPELIATSGFNSKLSKIHARGILHLIAIDEAHCISTWGHDFSSDATDPEWSEFWNRDDDEMIRKIILLLQRFFSPCFKTKSHITKKIDVLLHAEESCNRNKCFEKQSAKQNKNFISDSHRESSKQRLFNALKLAQQRHGCLKVDLESAVTFLEEECYKKYGKSGKSFYISQLACTVRWLSTASSTELEKRLGGSVATASSGSNMSMLKADSPLESAPLKVTTDRAASENKYYEGIGQAQEPPASISASQALTGNFSQDAVLPLIPSFTEFASKRDSKTARKLSPESKTIKKRMKI